MRSLFNRNPVFFTLFIIYILILTVLHLVFSKAELFLFINRHHGPFRDQFFKYFTNFGDASALLILTFILLFIRARWFFVSLLSFATTSVISQFLKRIIFTHEQRPRKFFEALQKIRLIDGIDVHSLMSFPSGHTTTAFAICTMLALFSGRKVWGAVFFVLAVLTAFSRVYLAQHFTADVFAGSLIGVSMSCFCYWLVNRSRFSEQPWMDKPIIRYR